MTVSEMNFLRGALVATTLLVGGPVVAGEDCASKTVTALKHFSGELKALPNNSTSKQALIASLKDAVAALNDPQHRVTKETAMDLNLILGSKVLTFEPAVRKGCVGFMVKRLRGISNAAAL